MFCDMESLTHSSSLYRLFQNSKNWLTLASFPIVCTDKSISTVPCRVFPEPSTLIENDPTDLPPSTWTLTSNKGNRFILVQNQRGSYLSKTLTCRGGCERPVGLRGVDKVTEFLKWQSQYQDEGSVTLCPVLLTTKRTAVHVSSLKLLLLFFFQAYGRTSLKLRVAI